MHQHEYEALLRREHNIKTKIIKEIMNQEEYEILLDEIERIKGLRQDYEDRIKLTENVLEIHEYQYQMNVLKKELKPLLDLKYEYSYKYCSKEEKIKMEEEKIKREERKIARAKAEIEREEKLTQTIREILFEDSTLLFVLRKVYGVCLLCSKNMAIMELINQGNLYGLSSEICFFKNLSERSQKEVIRRVKKGEEDLFAITRDYGVHDINVIKFFSEEVQQSIEKIKNEYGFEFMYCVEDRFIFTNKMPDRESFYNDYYYEDHEYYEFCKDEWYGLTYSLNKDEKISSYFTVDIYTEDDDYYNIDFILKFGDLR